MNTFQPPSKSDWVIILISIVAADLINRVLMWATGLPFTAVAFSQMAAVVTIFMIDRVYVKAILFLAVFSGLFMFVEDTVYGIIFTSYTFGTVLFRVVVWRQFHRVRKAKEYMEG